MILTRAKHRRADATTEALSNRVFFRGIAHGVVVYTSKLPPPLGNTKSET